MDITSSNTTLTIKTTHEESDFFQQQKPPLKSFTNGVVLKNNHVHVPVVINYKECLKNHAANLGGHAFDGCGEFMTSPSATPYDPTSLKCAACGCHRNFHRRDHDDSSTAVMEYQPHHRHRPPPPESPTSLSPPPISSSYPASAPHMLLALSDNNLLGPQNNNNHSAAPIAHIRTQSSGRKRFRTKFSQEQKDKMFGFANRVGWKIQKRDEQEIADFCTQIGVDRSVLKVWMHNNKSSLGNRNNVNLTNNNGGSNINNQEQELINNQQHSDSTGSPIRVGVNVVAVSNGKVSSSSS